MKLKVKIQSFSNIITNSSSEMFMLSSNFSTEDFITLITEQNKKAAYKGDWRDYDKLTREKQRQYDVCSGMGGCLEVFDAHRRYVCYSKSGFLDEDIEDDPNYVNPEMSFEDYLKEEKEDYGGAGSIIVDIDWGFENTIEWLKTEFNAVRIDD